MKSNSPILLTDPSILPSRGLEIQGLCDQGPISERLHEMGLRVGTPLTILGRAPFGGPLLIRFNTSFLALRSEEAECVTVIKK